MATIGDYGRYNSTIKTVLQAAEAAHNGYHQSAADLRALRLAVRDLQGILDDKKDPQGVSLKNEDGTYSPAVLILDYGRNYMAYVRSGKNRIHQIDAEDIATDAIDSSEWLGENWTAYTNGPSTLEWLEREGFSTDRD